VSQLVNGWSHSEQYRLKTKTALLVVTVLIISSILSINVLGINDTIVLPSPVVLVNDSMHDAENISINVMNKFSFNDPFLIPKYLSEKQLLSTTVIYMLLIIVLSVVITSTFGFKGLLIVLALLVAAHLLIQSL